MFLNETRMAVATDSGFDQDETDRLPFTMLLQNHRVSKSIDPRDKVYAFLGLASSAMIPFRAGSTTLNSDRSRSVRQV